MEANKEYCSSTKKRIHSYQDLGYWNGENSPTCEECGFVDVTRKTDYKPIETSLEKLWVGGGGFYSLKYISIWP